MMYIFLLNLWRMHKLTAAQVDAAVALGRITADEGLNIKSS